MEDLLVENSILVLKKPHVCGNDKWKLVRVGADCKIQCIKCGRIILINRLDLKKDIKKVEIDK